MLTVICMVITGGFIWMLLHIYFRIQREEMLEALSLFQSQQFIPAAPISPKEPDNVKTFARRQALSDDKLDEVMRKLVETP